VGASGDSAGYAGSVMKSGPSQCVTLEPPPWTKPRSKGCTTGSSAMGLTADANKETGFEWRGRPRSVLGLHAFPRYKHLVTGVSHIDHISSPVHAYAQSREEPRLSGTGWTERCRCTGVTIHSPREQTGIANHRGECAMRRTIARWPSRSTGGKGQPMPRLLTLVFTRTGGALALLSVSHAHGAESL
jgi:hypothetical protein